MNLCMNILYEQYKYIKEKMHINMQEIQNIIVTINNISILHNIGCSVCICI